MVDIVFNIVFIVFGLFIPQLIQFGLLWIGMKLTPYFLSFSEMIVHPNKRELITTLIVVGMLVFSTEINYQLPTFIEKMSYGSVLMCLFYMYRYSNYRNNK